MPNPITIMTTWQISTYDVWGNAKDGYDVNDVYPGNEIEMVLPLVVNNPGTPQEFVSAHPSDRLIRAVLGVRCQIETDGDDVNIEVKRKRDRYPLAELRCTSHESLSPVREKVVKCQH